eukprot:CAMPEP_0180498954 /NCGR_PEP_ID=MMETSP1036_2-20121128/43614_1 /TAXON_ID=632150 /ORGANISM="Azadinium spinosum, Strain 3D9" /LENGTH=30 /DNA_ID= /DNA_START= /DNA_END= /DNA_ORIENTATION=
MRGKAAVGEWDGAMLQHSPASDSLSQNGLS